MTAVEVVKYAGHYIDYVPKTCYRLDMGRAKTTKKVVRITPKMIAAAVTVLAGFNREFETLEEGAASILRAAFEAIET